MDALCARLLASEEPSVRFRVLTGALGKTSRSPAVREAQEQVRLSERVRLLLSDRTAEGTIPSHPYCKWYGAHWVLATLADLGYPPADADLIPLREQVYGWLLSAKHLRAVQTIAGRARRCASQEGNAVYALVTLGLADERTGQLVGNLLRWQWPDGGWNCDARPEAVNSSFWETLLPLRGLNAYALATGDDAAREAARRAAEVFLTRGLFRRRRDGQVMREEFIDLHYPAYWRYDILAALKVLAEAGLVGDERCAEALDLLESKRLADGGWPAEGRWYKVTDRTSATGGGASRVDWGGVNKRKLNEFVTAEALAVLRAAERPVAPMPPPEPLRPLKEMRGYIRGARLGEVRDDDDRY